MHKWKNEFGVNHQPRSVVLTDLWPLDDKIKFYLSIQNNCMACCLMLKMQSIRDIRNMS